MGFAVFRIQKLKASSVAKAQEHNFREKQQRHTDASKQHLNIVKLRNGFNSLQESIDSLLAKHEIKRVRKDATVLVDCVISASPDYFRPGKAENWGEYDNERLKAFLKQATDFVKREFGENAIAMSLHLDEATPHIHVSVVPVTDKSRLSAKDYFNRNRLIELQDSIGEAFKPLGLDRGVRGNKKPHTEAKVYYKQNNELKTTLKGFQRIFFESAMVMNSIARKFVQQVKENSPRLQQKEEMFKKDISEILTKNFMTDRQLSEEKAKLSFSTNQSKNEQNLAVQNVSKMTPK